MDGSITVYTGPMFSGKTQALMARLQSKERAHRKVLVVKPELDDRFHALSEIVSKQRTAQKFEKHASMAAYPRRRCRHARRPWSAWTRPSSSTKPSAACWT